MNGEGSGIDYAAVLSDLRARRAQIDAAIAGIEAPLGQVSSGSSVEVPAAKLSSNGVLTFQPDTFFGLSIPDAAKKYLAMRKRATTPEIVDALRSGGQPNATSENFQGTVASVIHRAYKQGAGIVRVGRGTWGLAEWYPNKPRKPVSDKNDSD